MSWPMAYHLCLIGTGSPTSQSNPTRFKSYDEDLLTLVERVDKAILEKLSALLDTWAILSLLSVSDPLASLDGKCLTLSSFVV